ncbi:MAG TPA: NIPSNAP family protein [Candidatus Acidoferrum sp.]|jgi:hypothetical protein|nr:NIPSNAP family protein [Candidatus Acidoferrum sp.]
MKRRDFLKTSLTASTLTGLGTASLGVAAAAESTGGAGRDYYELRAYRLKTGANHDLLDNYLEKAAIPAWNRLGIRSVGVFVQQERTGTPAATEVRDSSSVLVLIPHPSVESFASAGFRLNQDAEYQKAGAEYLQTPKSNPAFERIDSWLMLAFAGMPKLELPTYSREKKARMFEIRTYESYGEVKAQKKVDMFNSGEIETMHEVGLGPIFFGQALTGPNLPHLTYMLSAEDEEAHKKHWAAFGSHAVWNKLKNDPQYADTVSKIYNRFLVPTSYSQI